MSMFKAREMLRCDAEQHCEFLCRKSRNLAEKPDFIAAQRSRLFDNGARDQIIQLANSRNDRNFIAALRTFPNRDAHQTHVLQPADSIVVWLFHRRFSFWHFEMAVVTLYSWPMLVDQLSPPIYSLFL